MKHCCYCGRILGREYPPTREHIIPRSFMGIDAPTNILDCCSPCNGWRANKPFLEWSLEIEQFAGTGKAPHYQPRHIETMLQNIDLIQEYATDREGRLTVSGVAAKYDKDYPF